MNILVYQKVYGGIEVLLVIFCKRELFVLLRGRGEVLLVILYKQNLFVFAPEGREEFMLNSPCSAAYLQILFVFDLQGIL